MFQAIPIWDPTVSVTTWVCSTRRVMAARLRRTGEPSSGRMWRTSLGWVASRLERVSETEQSWIELGSVWFVIEYSTYFLAGGRRGGERRVRQSAQFPLHHQHEHRRRLLSAHQSTQLVLRPRIRFVFDSLPQPRTHFPFRFSCTRLYITISCWYHQGDYDADFE